MDILQMSGITKAFFGVTVLDKVDFSVRKGEVHALLGENGAGKSTLMNILAGVYTRDAGKIVFDGQEMDHVIPVSVVDATNVNDFRGFGDAVAAE